MANGGLVPLVSLSFKQEDEQGRLRHNANRSSSRSALSIANALLSMAVVQLIPSG